MWKSTSKSLTPKDFINQMDKPNFLERLFKEHRQVLETKVPRKLKAYTFAGPENRLLFKHNHVNFPGEKDLTINASYIEGYKRPYAYIATETPQSAKGAKALWETVWQHETNIVVMLNESNEDEKGYLYWNPEVGKSLQFGRLTVGTIKSWMILPTLQITKLVVADNEGGSLSVYHFLYSNWRVQDILPPAENFLEMLLKVREYRENTVRFGTYHWDLNPILVHCNDGLNRTMVYCAIDISISKYLQKNKVNIFSIVKKLRQERFRCLSDTHHYYFCYRTLYEYFANESSVL